MKKHSYYIKIEWTGNQGTGTINYQSYSRDHIISSAKKMIEIPGSSDPAFKGDETKYNPEELLVSTISSCHMLWYLHLCAVHGINVISYVDNASGIMEETDSGSGHFKEVTLAPSIKIESPIEKYQKAVELHHKTHEMCFISNSLNFEIKVEPHIF